MQQLYFSNPALMDYMKIAVPIHKGWDLGYVGAKLEAFAIAGCDTISEALTCSWLNLELIYYNKDLH
ncbi:hypothetical protein CVT25_005364 [Psilocybe cyanescens]|uniref:Uncharacterized protein n=1 Tax=Psilocybe cyanescens TaxID=93625 RepID=A0A409XS57_PSICY|nr:hypothetical protein CVT25_005364 [Psilocybe cyanescens]